MTDHQISLFNRYDISVEFERHMGCVQRGMAAHWPQIADLDDDQLQGSYPAYICPLQIFPQHAKFGEESDQGSDRFVLKVPYQGDNVLWHLYPSKIVLGLSGEIFRGQLILSHPATSQTAAKDNFERCLSEILLVISQQRKRICLFEESLPSLVKAEAYRLRVSKASQFVGIWH